jgi:NTE family protein
MGTQCMRMPIAFLAVLLLAGCASYGVIENTVQTGQQETAEYSIRSHKASGTNHDLTLNLAFSGGGTRAAAFAYGVMLELRDTKVTINGTTGSMLDQVDSISSVSGGSFTAAYYGLHGDGLFETFEDVFLRYDIEKQLVRQVLNPLHWFGRKGRTERAIEYYDKKIFHGATYADMAQPGRPLIIINASDLAYGVRFSFVQEYFDLLCSDLTSFPVSRAVTASSAVPIVFNPVVVENYPDCSDQDLAMMESIRQRAREGHDAELNLLVEGLESYADKDQRKYIHFVDGGITDNMGLRAMYDLVSISGGPEAYIKKVNAMVPDKLAIISIDASTSPVYEMDGTNKQPSIAHSIGAMSGVQLHRYNAATLELIETTLYDWQDAFEAEGKTMTPYLVNIGFEDIQQVQARQFFNKVPTSFSLTDDQVDKLIAAGRELLRSHPVFQQLVADLNDG